MSDIRIRTATAADTDAVVANNAAMALETEGRRLDPETLRTGVRRVLADPTRGVYYLAEIDGRVVGQLLITKEWSDWRDGWFWWIQSVFVAPEARRTGVYRVLHEHAVAEARRAGDVCGIRLYTEQGNTRAQQVYERMGMKRSAYVMYEADWSRE
ncbi:MAG: GNAT family N-acetyltransferase [Planctomycetes bacterium]|nr:GNAT family N-acetyltransferase [Planctomycetota bacterium]